MKLSPPMLTEKNIWRKKSDCIHNSVTKFLFYNLMFQGPVEEGGQMRQLSHMYFFISSRVPYSSNCTFFCTSEVKLFWYQSETTQLVRPLECTIPRVRRIYNGNKPLRNPTKWLSVSDKYWRLITVGLGILTSQQIMGLSKNIYLTNILTLQIYQRKPDVHASSYFQI